MWDPVRLPKIPPPIWGCDFPQGKGRSFHVATGKGFFRVTLGPKPAARKLLSGAELRAVFDPECDTGFVRGSAEYEVFGPNTGIPPFIERPNGERIGGDPEAGLLQILDENEESVVDEIDLGPLRGEWVVAGFSEDGRYLVVADPVGVRVFREV